MLSFFKRFGRALADIVTSKKAIATAIGAVATAAGHPEVGAVVASYVVGQGLADRGKEEAKKKAHLDAERASSPAAPPVVRGPYLAESARRE